MTLIISTRTWVNVEIISKQNAWLEPYIELNTIYRTRASNDFEKSFLQIIKQCNIWKNHGKPEIAHIRLINKWDKLI